MSLSLGIRFQNELAQTLGDRLANVEAQLAGGEATDYPDYKYRVGYIRALRDIADDCATINAYLEKN